MFSYRHLLSGPIFFALALAVLIGCTSEVKTQTPAPALPQVGVLTIEAKDVPDEPEFVGETESSRPVEIRSQVTGILKERYFEEGREVKKGAKLYRIDPVPFEAAVSSAKARIAQQEARLVQAEQNLTRVKPLLAEQAVSQKDVDDAVAEELAAKAALQEAKSELVRAAWALDNTLIVAPISGLIERTRFYEGHLVSAQTSLLTVMHRINPMYVTVSLPESFVLKRRREIIEERVREPGIDQLTGILKFADGSTYPHPGLLDFTDVAMKTETGTRQARLVFPNPQGVLMPGQFVSVRFKGTIKRDAILVPQQAVQQGAQGQFVIVVGPDERAEVRWVTALAWEHNRSIVEEGLKPGERIVVDGLHRIMIGEVVKPVPAAETSGPGASVVAQQETGHKETSRQ